MLLPEIKLTYADILPLIDPNGNEGCGFLIGTENIIAEIWRVTSITPSPDMFAISRNDGEDVLSSAKAQNKRVFGIIHTHPFENDLTGYIFGPSKKDLFISKLSGYGMPNALHAVYEVTNGTLYLYNALGILT